MQLRPNDTPSPEDRRDEPAAPAAAPLSPWLRECEARRCHMCGCKHPCFGFGTPGSTNGKTLWACMAHRHEVDCLVSGNSTRPALKTQPGLFNRETR